MITVSILINGQPIYTRSAVNTGIQDKSGRTCYKLDDGQCVMHHHQKGAVPLAVTMLKTIKEPKVNVK